jgi:hypothetical protein
MPYYIEKFSRFKGHSWETDPHHVQMLYNVVREHKPNLCLEIGSFKGTSTAAIAIALAHNGNGSLIAVDIGIRPELKVIGRKFSHVKIIGSDSHSFLDGLREKLDLIFLDGSHKLDVVKGEWIRAQKNLHEDTVLCAHDTYAATYGKSWGDGPNWLLRQVSQQGWHIYHHHEVVDSQRTWRGLMIACAKRLHFHPDPLAMVDAGSTRPPMQMLRNVQNACLTVVNERVGGAFVNCGRHGVLGTTLMAYYASQEGRHRKTWILDASRRMGTPSDEDKLGAIIKGVETHLYRNNLDLASYWQYLGQEGLEIRQPWGLEETLFPSELVDNIAVLCLDQDDFKILREDVNWLYRNVVPHGFIIVEDRAFRQNRVTRCSTLVRNIALRIPILTTF